MTRRPVASATQASRMFHSCGTVQSKRGRAGRHLGELERARRLPIAAERLAQAVAGDAAADREELAP